MHVASHCPEHVPWQVTLGAVALSVHVPLHVPLHDPSAWMPVPPLAPPAAHVPSQRPVQSTATPPCAAHEPVQLPEHEPVQSNVGADALPVHPPVQEISMVPPVQVGGLTLTSQLPLTWHPAWQLAEAWTDAVHCAGVTSIVSAPFATPVAV